MTTINEIVLANQNSPAPSTLPAAPGRHVAIVTCMDARIDGFAPFGLAVGDAHFIRNAGGIVTDDVLRSLAISQRALGTREVAVIHHSRCGMQGFDDQEFRSGLAAESGVQPAWDVPGFTDAAADAAESAQRVRDCAFLPHRDAVRGFVLDIETGVLTEVS